MSKSTATDPPAWHDDAGSTLIEFALVLPVFLFVLIGAMQMFLGLFFYCNATFASRAAARYASVHSAAAPVVATNGSVQSMVTSMLWTGTLASPVITTTWPGGNRIGGTVNVTVGIDLPLPIPFTDSHRITVGSSAQRQITY